ncbi:hypothetical protein D9757_004659 [Collybiopsis confluens]|uniref:DUF6593 domain-containing protein n=1 Tax=Collybiopsis confluens TaxID=2823264 RepID=A0A8H5HS86_9AGAR|nr:hypothetical protein D9757_004659 [Collybiopsis confluens]
MIITETDVNEVLKPPIDNLRPLQRQISGTIPRSPSPIPPPVHPALQYGSTSPATPPGYGTSNRPLEPVTYIFEPEPESENAMILRASSSVRHVHEPIHYHVSVSMNCFTPSSHITTIRNYHRRGEVVGDFEIAAKDSKNANTVFIRGNEHPLEDVLVSSSRLFRNQWMWKPLDTHITLYWDDGSAGNSIACFTSKDRTSGNLLAKFIPRSHRRRSGRDVEYPKLEVTPQGHDFFEDVLISLLIIERLRTNA